MGIVIIYFFKSFLQINVGTEIVTCRTIIFLHIIRQRIYLLVMSLIQLNNAWLAFDVMN